MVTVKKLLSLIISASLVITLFPTGGFAVPVSSVVPQAVFNDYGKITQSALYDSDTLVINIQDLHNNKEVQNNIYNLLNSFNKKYENVEFYMEGASRDIDFDILSSIGAKNLSVLMDNMFKNDKLSGTEYFGYKNKKILNPVEDKDIYNRNIQNYSVLIRNKKEIQKLLLKEYMNLRSLNKYLTREQKEILNSYNAYLNKRLSREKFCKILYGQMKKKNIPDWRYPNSKLYHDITKAGSRINQKKVNLQLQAILFDLKKILSYHEYAEFLQKSDNLSDVNFVFSFLSAKISAADKIKYPDLFGMIKLREISSLVNPIDLVEEDRQKVEDILLTESTTSANKDIVFLNLFFEVYKKLLLAENSSKEYEYYKDNYALYSDIYSKYLNDNSAELYYYGYVAEQFNELNLRRNKIFLEKMGLSKGTPSVSNTAEHHPLNVRVLISGGFHSYGITKLLDENKISYITLTPNIKKNDYLYEKQYLNSIVEQADADFNAISKRPLLEQNADLIARDIMSSMNEILPALLETNLTTEQITQTVNKKIEENSARDFIKFNLDKDGIASITIDGKVYMLDYQSGEVKLSDGITVTTLAKNIKTLIREILLDKNIRLAKRLNIGQTKKKWEDMSTMERAEKIFLEHNILFSNFANDIITSVFKRIPNNDDRSQDGVYNTFMEIKNDIGDDFKDCKVIVSNAKSLIGVRPDGYGNTEEYGLLFYVVWEQDEYGNDKAKNILISNELLKYLESFDEHGLRQFFYDLLWHESWEHLALTGQDERFNEYVFSGKLSMTSEVFHEYIQTPEFTSYIVNQGYNTSQIRLMEQMERVIYEVNRKNSEYSDILSLFSIDSKSEYSSKGLDTFLSVRTGEQDVIDSCISQLADKTFTQLETLYITQQQNINPNYDIKNDLDGFIKFLNKFIIVYRKSNEYMTPDKLADFIKKQVIRKYSVTEEDASKISIQTYEFKDFPKTQKLSEEEIEFNKTIKSKRVFIFDDIISKRSETFNNMYSSLMDRGAAGVYGLAFFDLSKEPKENDNIISDKTFERILSKPSILLNVLNNVNGNVKKYVAYWLTRLLNDERGVEVIKQISSMDNEIVNNLLHSLFDILKNKETVRGIESYDIINLILAIGFGNKIDITNISKEELDAFLNKYGFEFANINYEPLEISYDDWHNDIAALIIFAYMSGYQYIKALGVNDIDGTENRYGSSNRSLIESMCGKYIINFEDIKRKLKHSYDGFNEEAEDEDVKNMRLFLEAAREEFEKGIRIIAEKYNITAEIPDDEQKEKYVSDVEKLEKAYKDAVIKVMLEAKRITLKRLAEQKIVIDENMFLIMGGGSLVKGDIMTDSDIYYDIVVPDGIISKSIGLRFAPLYSSILRQAGLTNYHVLKYSTTHMNKQNINTFVDEKELVPFLNYEILSTSEKKKNLYDRYMTSILDKSLSEAETTAENLALVNKRYSSIAREGDGWLESSFLISYEEDKGKIFTTRSVLQSLETKLNEIVFDYLVYYKNVGDMPTDIPVSVKEQIEFIKNGIYKDNKELQVYMDSVFGAWQFLASCRYVSKNNSWTDFLPGEKQAIETINKFVLRNTTAESYDALFEEKINEITNCKEFLSVIENFAYDNSMDMEIFRNGYAKYAHLEAWKQSASKDKDNEELFLFAQAVSLLIDIDKDVLEKKLSKIKIKGFDKYFKKLTESIDAIKRIDDKFPEYSHIAGERSIQNYWDAVAKCAGNEETLLALIAHKLTKAQVTKEKENEYLLYAVYLPLAKRFGNADIYEYVRNDLFEYSHPGAYLNLLKIIETLYGKPYSEIPQINEKIRNGIKEFLSTKGLPDSVFNINYRVKSLYSIYEKLNSSRRNEDSANELLEEADINAIKYILSFNGTLFDDIIRKAYPEKNMNIETIKKEILEYVEENFVSLSADRQKQLRDILTEMKNAIFYDYNIVDYVNKYLSEVITDCRNPDGSLNTKELKNKLEKDGRFFELWFVELFEKDLRDFIGLHVVIDDVKYKEAVNIARGEKDSGLNEYSELLEFIKNAQDLEFARFEEDKKNKQARLKISAAVKSSRFSLPVELCFYEKSDHEAETYGVYNFKKISSPHYIYKMGKRIVSAFFESVFLKEMDYSFLNNNEDELSYEETYDGEASRKTEAKRMIFTADGFVPTSNLAWNFDRINYNFRDTVTCFVEYDGKVYIQQLPNDATIFDLATGRYFSDDRDVSVYNEAGEPLTSNLAVENYGTYKIIKGHDTIVLPSSEADIHTTRAKLIFRGDRPKKSFITKAIKELGSSDYISKLINIILSSDEYKRLIDEKKLRYSDIADRIYQDQVKNKDFSLLKKNVQEDLQEQYFKNDIVTILKILSDFYNRNELLDKTSSRVFERSVQIAAHYNLANVLELFEALDYGLINFEDIKDLYRTCIYIKTESKTISANDIIDKIEKHFKVVRVDGYGYNLIINGIKYKVEDAKDFDYDFLKQLMSIEDLNLIQVSSKNDTKWSDDKESILITIDFRMPEEPLALMSLGNNVDRLVKNYAVSHPDMVKRVMLMAEKFVQPEDVPDFEDISSLFDEYPVLLMQILLGIYSEDGSAVLSEETPFLTQDETEILKNELQTVLSSNEIFVSDTRIAVSRSLDLAESADSYSFATLDVSNGVATLFISEAFLRMLDKLPANEKEYFLIQLAAHEAMEYSASVGNKDFNYEAFHEQLESDTDQKNLMEKAASVAPDVVKMRISLINVINALQSLKINNISGDTNIDDIFSNIDIIPNDITGALNNFAKVLGYTLSGDVVPVIYGNEGLEDISLEDLKDIIFLISVTNPQEKAKIFSVFEGIAKTNEKFTTVDGILSVLENYFDKNSARFMLMSEFVKYLYSDTSLQRPVRNIEPVLPEPSADIGDISSITSLDEQTKRVHRLLAAA